MKIRVGIGFDVHRLVTDRELWLGGVRLEHEKGLLGHSDADVLIHAICDALLGAANMRDIGYHFPDTAGEFKNIDRKTHIPAMQQTLSAVLGIDEDDVSVKATTTEKLGFTGREEGISAYATVLIVKE